MNKKALFSTLIILIAAVILIIGSIIYITGNFKFKTGKVTVNIDYDENAESSNEIEIIEIPSGIPAGKITEVPQIPEQIDEPNSTNATNLTLYNNNSFNLTNTSG